MNDLICPNELICVNARMFTFCSNGTNIGKDCIRFWPDCNHRSIFDLYCHKDSRNPEAICNYETCEILQKLNKDLA